MKSTLKGVTAGRFAGGGFESLCLLVPRRASPLLGYSTAPEVFVARRGSKN